MANLTSMARIMKRNRSLKKKGRYLKKSAKPKRRFAGKAGIARVVNKMMAKKLETKQSVFSSTDGIEIAHNNFQILDDTSTFLKTVTGLADPMDTTGNRIGDEITLKGISMKMMIELNERYSDVTFRLMVVKSAKGDTPTRANLFAGTSGNKMLDYINVERYTVIAQKYFKITAPNVGAQGGSIVNVVPPFSYGLNHANNGELALSRATKIIRLYIPGEKFGRSGVVKYENASTSQVKFFDYNVVLYSYSNYTTSQDVVNIARVNEYIKTMHYTDA